SYGTFIALRVVAQQNVQAIIEEAAAGGFPDDPDAARIRALYAAYMDSARAESLGIAPVRSGLDRIDALDGAAGLSAYFAGLQRDLGQGPFSLSVQQDQRRSQEYAVYI